MVDAIEAAVSMYSRFSVEIGAIASCHQVQSTRVVKGLLALWSDADIGTKHRMLGLSMAAPIAQPLANGQMPGEWLSRIGIPEPLSHDD